MKSECKPVKRVSDKSNYVCDQCGHEFNRKSGLQRHRFVHSTDRPFVCRTRKCMKRFKSQHSLYVHRRRHSSVRRFKCEECGKGFKVKEDLKQHAIRVHSSDRSFQCVVTDCGRSYTNLTDLLNHKRIHTSAQPFECDVCHRRFKLERYLKRHRLSHSNVRKFVCHWKACRKRYKYKSDLDLHQSIHTGVYREFVCDKCGKKFNRKTPFYRHRRVVHSKSEMEYNIELKIVKEEWIEENL